MKRSITLPVILLISVLLSCNKAEKKSALINAMEDKSVEQMQLSSAPPAPSQTPIPMGNPGSFTDSAAATLKTAEHIDWDKKIIKTASLKVEVKNFKSYNATVREIIRGSGGYISGEEQSSATDRTETSLTIKVPVAAFDGVMNQLSAGDVTVQERKVSTEDVSAEVIDTRSRLEAKKEMRVKYLEFLRQSKNMAEVLQVQAEVNNIQEEIEAASGRIQYLSQKAAYSTISLSFFQPLAGFHPGDATPSFFSRLSSSFGSGMHWIGELVLGLISVWPLLLVIFGIYFWLRTRKKAVVVQRNQ